jgi:hypothetical protein
MIQIYNNPTLLDFLMIANRLPDDEMEQFCALTGQEKYIADYAAINCFMCPGPKWVFKLEDGTPLSVGGYTPTRPGVCIDFMMNTPESFSPRYWYTVTRNVRRIMDNMLAIGGAHRLECISLASRTKAREWYGVLGLHFEGTMHGYCANGADAVLYSRVRH